MRTLGDLQVSTILILRCERQRASKDAQRLCHGMAFAPTG
jgi:hypothetical protein